MTSIYTLDPKDTAETPAAALAIRPASLDGKTLGLLSNNKPHSEELLRMVADIIVQRYSLAEVVEYNKGGHQWPAERSALGDLASRCDVMIHATAEWGSCTSCSVHDAMEMELLGVASTVLTTRPFVSQARAMARLRGDADYGLAVIDHPIVTLTPVELADRAAVAAPQAMRHLLDR